MRALVLLFTLLLPLTTQAQTNDTSNPIVARMDALVRAINAGDLAAIGAIYAPDAALLAPGQPAITGRAAIQAHYAQALEAGLTDVQFMTFDIRGFDQNATEIGETVSMVGTSRVVGRYMHFWEVVDGQILLTRDMYHILSVE